MPRFFQEKICSGMKRIFELLSLWNKWGLFWSRDLQEGGENTIPNFWKSNIQRLIFLLKKTEIPEISKVFCAILYLGMAKSPLFPPSTVSFIYRAFMQIEAIWSEEAESSHRSRRGPRFCLSSQQKFKQIMKIWCSGFHKINKRKKSTEGPTLLKLGF